MKVRINVSFSIETEDFDSVSDAVTDATQRVKRLAHACPSPVDNINIRGSARDEERGDPETTTRR